MRSSLVIAMLNFVLMSSLVCPAANAEQPGTRKAQPNAGGASVPTPKTPASAPRPKPDSTQIKPNLPGKQLPERTSGSRLASQSTESAAEHEVFVPSQRLHFSRALLARTDGGNQGSQPVAVQEIPSRIEDGVVRAVATASIVPAATTFNVTPAVQLESEPVPGAQGLTFAEASKDDVAGPSGPLAVPTITEPYVSFASAVPEPSTSALTMLGLCMIAVGARSARRSRRMGVRS